MVGHHFARPGNRFWKTLHAAELTDRLLDPSEDRLLLQYGYGVTNLVDRATARADQLSAEELTAGHQNLAIKVQQYRPQILAILGISAYRTAFGRPKAQLGQQAEQLHDAQLWVLPNPSGLNAHYQLADLKQIYQELTQFQRHLAYRSNR